MPYHLHVLNLREDATDLDIRRLFSGMGIQWDGIVIVGGPDGEAFVTFESESDLLRVVQRDGEQDLDFKIATDADRSKGINRMRQTSPEKADSMLAVGGYSKDTEFPDDVHCPKRQQENFGDHGKRYEGWGASDSDNTYRHDSKRRKTGGNSPLISGSDTHEPDEYAESCGLPRRERPPLLSSQCQMGEDGSSLPNTAPAHSFNQLQAGPSYPYTSIPMQVPYPPLVGQPPVGPPLVGPFLGPQPVVHPLMGSCLAGPPSMMGLQLVGSPSLGPQPVGPGFSYDHHHGFQAGKSPNPVPPWGMPQYITGANPGDIPIVPGIPDSLLMSLLPTVKQQRYCIQVSDLPADVTAHMVWDWVGGPHGTAHGVILLKPSIQYAVAFVVYDNEFDCDERLKFCTITVAKSSMADTCIFIKKFINRWRIMHGRKTRNSPIYETTLAGIEWNVDCKTFLDFANMSPTLPGELNEGTAATNVKTSVVLPGKPNADPFAKNVMSVPAEPRITPSSKVFLGVYKLNPRITATKVRSWFSEGLSVLKVTFHKKNGPKGSEAMAFILFEDYKAYENAERGLTGKDLITKRHSFDGAYTMIRRYGDKCKITETTTHGGDRTISPAERKQPPFLVEEKVQSQPNTEPFTLIDSMTVTYSHLKGVPYQTPSKTIWNWYPKAKAIVVLNNTDGKTDAVVAFQTLADQQEAIRIYQYMKQMKIVEYACGSLCMLSTQEAMILFSQWEVEMTISAGLNQPDRKINAEEAKFIMNNARKSGVAKPSVSRSKFRGTSEQNTSFMYHLKTAGAEAENEALYLMLCHVKRNLTACQVHAFFPDALCALKVGFDGHSDDSHAIKEFAYLLLKDVEGREAAKLLFAHHKEKWMNPMHIPTARSAQRAMLFKEYSRKCVEESLSQICEQSTIFESSPFGVDSVVEQPSIDAINPPFLIAHGPPYLHYAQLTGYDEAFSASEILDWFASYAKSDEVKGVILLRKSDLMACIAFVAFSSLECRNRIADCKGQSFTNCWPSVLKMTEQQTMGVLKWSTADYTIKVSRDGGPDRDLNPAERKILGIPPKDSTSMAAREMTDNETKGQIVRKFVEGKNAGPSNDISDGFYIRLKKVPPGVTTACKLLSMYTNAGALAESATLVRDFDGVGEVAYVMFDEVEHRDSALSLHPYSVRCTANGRAVRLAEYEPEYEILESTKYGIDRLMSPEERAGDIQ